MSDPAKTPKERIDDNAGKAIAKVDQLLADPTSKDLNADLKEIRTRLLAIKGDPHKVQ